MHSSYQTDMDPHAATIEKIVTAITALQDRQQASQISAQEDTQFDMRAPPPPPSMDQMAPPPIPQGTPFVIQRPTEVIQPHATI